MSKKNKYSVQAAGVTEPIEEQDEKAAVVASEKAALVEATPEEVKEEEEKDLIPTVTETTKTEVLQSDKPATVPLVQAKTNSVQVAPAQQASTANRRVQTFLFQCKQYIALCNGSIANEDQMTKKLYQFATIIRMIINTTDTEVYDAAYDFFKEYRNSILSENTVFAYIHKIPTEQSIRMQTVYTSFREMVEANITKKHFALDYGLIRDNMKLPAQHPLLNWMRRKLGNNN